MNLKNMKFSSYILQKILLTFCLILCFGINEKLSAKHIIGGEVTYECVGINNTNNTVTFELTFVMYRDCAGGGAGFEQARFGIYEGFGSNWDWKQTVISNPGFAEPVEAEDNPCIEVPANLCVEKATYVFDITLPISNNSYIIAYQRCCRNNSILNIVAPEDTGAAFTVEIRPAAQQICNNSPVFNDFPPILICEGEPLVFDHSASDVEGHSLTYKFCSPLNGGGPFGSNETPGNPNACDGIIPEPSNCPPPYPNVVFKLPNFSFSNPVASNPQMTINPFTGLITGTPNLAGQYVVGVCVEERDADNNLLSIVQRDFQFNVTQCLIKVQADIKEDAVVGIDEYLINSCGENTITFENESTDENFIESYYWEFKINGDTVISNDKDATINFPGIGEYTGIMILNKGTVECSDTAQIYVNVYPDIEADYSFDYDTCSAGPVEFYDNSSSGSGTILTWDWDFGNNENSQEKNPFHTFTVPGIKDVVLEVSDINDCKDTIEQTIAWFPAPPLIIVEPSNYLGCAPAEIFFNNLSSPINEEYTVNWSFGDGETGNEISPTHVFEEVGIYSLNLEIISPIGCVAQKSFPNWIEVEPKPTADFSYSPERPNNFNATIFFEDESEGAISWQWNFNNEGNAFDPNPTYTFKDTGEHFVELVVLHPSGCPDTIIKRIDIEPEVTFYLPNAFTPNADAKNDQFLGRGYFEGMSDFRMTIWNRWGERIFETTDPLQGWNGRKHNSGELEQNGVYVYLVTYTDPRGKPIELKGFATLIR